MVDVYLMCARMFATWFRIKLIMGFIIIWCIIQMSISSWLTESDGGDFANMKITQPAPVNGTATTTDYSTWATSICTASPYIYIEPFSFTFTAGGTDYANAAYCGFPRTNSVLRIFSCILCFLVLGALFFETPLSSLGRTLQMILGALFFASFVLDANAVAIGTSACAESFVNTYLYDDLTVIGAKLTCKMSDYAGVAVINFLIACLLLLLQGAWSNCTDMYSGVPRPAAKAADTNKA